MIGPSGEPDCQNVHAVMGRRRGARATEPTRRSCRGSSQSIAEAREELQRQASRRCQRGVTYLRANRCRRKEGDDKHIPCVSYLANEPLPEGESKDQSSNAEVSEGGGTAGYPPHGWVESYPSRGCGPRADPRVLCARRTSHHTSRDKLRPRPQETTFGASGTPAACAAKAETGSTFVGVWRTPMDLRSNEATHPRQFCSEAACDSTVHRSLWTAQSNEETQERGAYPENCTRSLEALSRKHGRPAGGDPCPTPHYAAACPGDPGGNEQSCDAALNQRQTERQRERQIRRSPERV